MRWLEVLAILLWPSCRKSPLNPNAGILAISCPSQPGAVISNGQDITVNFGNVPIGEKSTLILDLVSISGVGVTLTEVQPLVASSVLAFPLAAGVTVESSPPTTVQASFTPTQAGTQSASWRIELGSGPSINLTLQGNGFPVALSVAPDPVDFGSVEIHASSSTLVTVTNGSSQPIDLALTLPDGGLFKVGPLQNGNLDPGASLTFNATYSPLQIGTDHAFFTLSGCIGCAQGEIQVPLHGNGVQSTLTFPDPLNFGFVPPQTSFERILALKNIGNVPIQITAPPVLNPGSAVPLSGQPPIFAFSGSTPSYPYTLNAGDAGSELDLPIVFTPNQIGAYLDGTVTLQSSDPGASHVTIDLQGYGGGARISCQPSSLDLGPVALGFSSSRSLVCLNAGTNVPGHPEAALQLSQGQLAVTDPHFQATLQAGTDVLLTAGQSATIQVGFAPPSAGDGGSYAGTLQIGSNDVAQDPLSIPVVGRGVVPGPCNAAILPVDGLNFGEVPKGTSALLQFAVENQGDNYCIVKDVAVAPGSDPAFTLPDGPIPYQLVSFPGDPDNGSNLPVSFRVPVQFAPTQNETQATGSISFQISNATPISQIIALSGSSVPACLTFTPSPIDFGLVGFNAATHNLCFTPRQWITVDNDCSSPVTLQSITLDTKLDVTAQFALQSLPTLPMILSAGGQTGFAVTFQATDGGPQAETIQVATSEFLTPYDLSLTGNAETTGSRTDTFTVTQKQLDLVLVLDSDDDSFSNIPGRDPSFNFVEQLPNLIEQATTSQLDYRIAIVTSGTCLGGPPGTCLGACVPGDQGWLEPCDHCMVDGGSPVFITPQSKPNPSSVLSQLASAIWRSGNSQCLTGGGPVPNSAGGATDEQFFEVPYQVFDPLLLSGHNSGFFRQQAYLGFLTINVDSEDDFTDLSVNEVASFLQGLKPGNPNLVSWSYMDVDLGNFPNAKVSQLVAATNGFIADMSLAGWEKRLLNFFTATIDLGTFHLGALPAPDSLQVIIDGLPIPQSNPIGAPNWTYDPLRNAVVLAESALPVPGTIVSISYTLACP